MKDYKPDMTEADIEEYIDGELARQDAEVSGLGQDLARLKEDFSLEAEDDRTKDFSERVPAAIAEVDRALAQFKVGETKLDVFSDQERARRRQVLLSAFDEVKDRVIDEADGVIASSSETLKQLEHADPLDSLSTAEFDRANARREFVREDSETLSLSKLTERVRAAAATGDKASAFLWSRYARRRIDTELTAGRSGGGLSARDSALLRSLSTVLDELDKRLADPGKERKLEAARARIAEAQKLRVHAMTQRRVADGTAQEQLRRTREHYSSTF